MFKKFVVNAFENMFEIFSWVLLLWSVRRLVQLLAADSVRRKLIKLIYQDERFLMIKNLRLLIKLPRNRNSASECTRIVAKRLNLSKKAKSKENLI